MKRDLELIRKIVLAVEDSDGGWAPDPLEIEGYTDAQIAYHCYLLIDAGLAKGADLTTFGSDGPEAQITQLTWAGHEFVASARNEQIWRKAMSQVQKNGGSITLGVLIELLSGLMKGAFGVP